MTERFTTGQDATEDIIQAIEAGGTDVASASEFDLEAIFDDVFEYRVDSDEAGNQLANTAGFEQIVDDQGFWEAIMRHAL